jgi:hypothetical protein
MLLEMPEVNWALNYDEEKEYIVNSPAEENPVMQPGKESTV